MGDSKETKNAGGENPFNLEEFLAERIRIDMHHAVRDVFDSYGIDTRDVLMYTEMFLDHINFEVYDYIAYKFLKDWAANNVGLLEGWLAEFRK